MSQQDLINWRPMTTTREMRSALRARAEATPSSKSETTHGKVESAGPAAVAGLPKTRSIENSQGRRLSQSDETEFNLPDEDRRLQVLWTERHCRCCGTQPGLFRERGKYQVRCSGAMETWNLPTYENASWPCQLPTPWLKSSAQAINHWKLVAKLQS